MGNRLVYSLVLPRDLGPQFLSVSNHEIVALHLLSSVSININRHQLTMANRMKTAPEVRRRIGKVST